MPCEVIARLLETSLDPAWENGAIAPAAHGEGLVVVLDVAIEDPSGTIALKVGDKIDFANDVARHRFRSGLATLYEVTRDLV